MNDLISRKALLKELNNRDVEPKNYIEHCGFGLDRAIKLVLEAPAAESEESAIDRLQKARGIISDPLIIADNNGRLRPVKRTTRKQIYEIVLKLQYFLGVKNRWFPSEWEREIELTKENEK
jgi:hypothetical protein